MNKGELNNIIKACIRGDRKSQKAIFDLYSSKMMSVCLRYTRDRADAEDVLQDGFVKVFTKMDQFSFNGSFEGWIRRIVTNSALRFLERKKHFLPLDHDRINDQRGGINKSIEEEEERGQADKILSLIQALPEGYKKVFNMYVFEGFDHNEIATVLGITSSTSRSQLTKARKFLKNELVKLNIIIT